MKLLDQYIELHRDPDIFEGYSIKQFIGEIGVLVNRYQCETYLDYGCGKAVAYKKKFWHKRWRPTPVIALYDPAVPEYSSLPEEPKEYDFVVCSDVMEHVPEDEVDALIERLVALTGKVLFVSVCSRPAKRILPNGMNAHVTLHLRDWWYKKFNNAIRNSGKSILFELKETE